METVNHEYYVSLEVAKLLKQAGFDWEVCDGYIIYEDGHVFTTNFQTPYNFNGDNKDLFSSYRGNKGVFSKPTLEVAQRWLRDTKSILLYIVPKRVDRKWKWDFWYIDLRDVSDIEQRYSIQTFSTYEQAQEAGIKKALEIVLEEEK